MKNKWNLGLTILLLAGLALSRWPGTLPLNFSVVYAIAFCSGAFPRLLPWTLALATNLAMDISLNIFYYDTDVFSDYQAVNYLAYTALYFLGRQFTSKSPMFKLVSGGLLGAVVFYVITNTAAWLQNPAYAKTLSGWIQALTVGTPNWPQTWTFFRNTLLSGGLFTGLVAAIVKFYEASQPEPEENEEPEEAPAAEPADPDKKEA